jgi:hypothetical protein
MATAAKAVTTSATMTALFQKSTLEDNSVALVVRDSSSDIDAPTIVALAIILPAYVGLAVFLWMTRSPRKP